MEKYSFLKYSDYDQAYYSMLFDRARNGGLFEGKIAVDFLKLSNISPVGYQFICFDQYYDQHVYRQC
jgi:hypothetical protein